MSDFDKDLHNWTVAAGMRIRPNLEMNNTQALHYLVHDIMALAQKIMRLEQELKDR